MFEILYPQKQIARRYIVCVVHVHITMYILHIIRCTNTCIAMHIASFYVLIYAYAHSYVLP